MNRNNKILITCFFLILLMLLTSCSFSSGIVDESSCSNETSIIATTASTNESSTIESTTTIPETTTNNDFPWDPIVIPEPYCDFDFTNGAMVDVRSNGYLSQNLGSVHDFQYRYKGNQFTRPAFVISESGQYVSFLMKDYEKNNINQFYSSELGFSLEIEFVNNNSKSTRTIFSSGGGGKGITVVQRNGIICLLLFNGATNEIFDTNLPIDNGELTHLVVTGNYNSSERKTSLRFYINGDCVAEKSLPYLIVGSDILGSSDEFFIGVSKAQKNEFMYMMNDFAVFDLKVYVQCLTDLQVQTLFSQNK